MFATFVDPQALDAKTICGIRNPSVVVGIPLHGNGAQLTSVLNNKGLLVAYFDNTPTEAWTLHRDDTRFHLYEEDTVLMHLITPEMTEGVDELVHIVAPRTFAGLLAAAKFARRGLEPYEGADRDAHVADALVGEYSPYGEMIRRALCTDPSDKTVCALFAELVPDDGVATISKEVGDAILGYGPIGEETLRLVASCCTWMSEGVAIVSIDGNVAIDLDLFLMEVLKKESVVVVDHNDKMLTVACRAGTLNLRLLMGAKAGRPNCIPLAYGSPIGVARRISEALNPDTPV